MLVSTGIVSQCGEIRKGLVTQISRGTTMPLLLWNYTFIILLFFLHSPFSIKKKYPFSESVHGALQGCCYHLLGHLFLITTSPCSVHSNLQKFWGSGFVVQTPLGMLSIGLSRRYKTVSNEVNLSCPNSLYIGEKVPRIGQNIFIPLMVAVLVPVVAAAEETCGLFMN